MVRIITGRYPNIVKKGYSYMASNLELSRSPETEARVRKYQNIPAEAVCRKDAKITWGSTVLDFVWFEVIFDE